MSNKYMVSNSISLNSFFSEPIITYARALRKKQTIAEKKLWQFLRNRKLKGYKFRRQHPVSSKYIVDFFCNEARLAIELDGYYHHYTWQREYDEERTNFLIFLNIKVIRFTNEDVLFEIDKVLKRILEECEG